MNDFLLAYTNEVASKHIRHCFKIRPLCWQCAFEAYLATAMIKCTGSLPGASLWTMELSTGAKH